jgi:hypothetical protein
VRDLASLALVVGFFAIATLFARACHVVVGVGSDVEEVRER